jgi:hypothetical protein
MHIAIAALLTVSTAAMPEVANPGFEEVRSGATAPAAWHFTSLPDQAELVRYEAVPLAADPERKALSITVAANHPGKEVAYNAHQSIRNIEEGKTYRVTAKVQTKGLRTLPMIVVQCLNARECGAISTVRSEERAIDRDLVERQTIHADVTVPRSTASLHLRIGIPATGNAGGTALIDDVSIAEIK